MEQNSIKHNITLPLSYSQAVEHLTACRTENFYELDDKSKKYECKKTSQHLSVRLRLIFKKLPVTTNKKQPIYRHSISRMNQIGHVLSHQLSTTRTEQFYRKLQYIYYSITMCYIQHIHSPFSSEDVPEKWIQNKKFTDDDFIIIHKYFAQKTEQIKNKIRASKTTGDSKKLSKKNLAKKIQFIPIEAIIEILNEIEQFVLAAYNVISKKYISHKQIRNLLLGVEEYSVTGKNQLLFKNLFQSSIEKTLKDYFKEYDNYCELVVFLALCYDEIKSYLEDCSLGLEADEIAALTPVPDELSNTKTEVSQLEFDFFAYLLDAIPTRGKENLSNKLSHGEWQNLPIDVRNQIVDYINQMTKQPKRLIRFTTPVGLRDEIPEIKLLLEVQDLCRQIKEPQ